MNDSLHNEYAAQAAKYKLEFQRSLGALVGIAQGLLGDRHLSDAEIHYLNEWLTRNDAVAYAWPGDVILRRIKAVLEDGVVTETERAHLVATLEDLCGGTLEDMAQCVRATNLAYDAVERIQFAGATFCLTGDFVYAPREICERAIECRGGHVRSSISKKLGYLVVGARGSEAWKHGSFGTKIERAMLLKGQGAPIIVVEERVWTAALDANGAPLIGAVEPVR